MLLVAVAVAIVVSLAVDLMLLLFPNVAQLLVADALCLISFTLPFVASVVLVVVRLP